MLKTPPKRSSKVFTGRTRGATTGTFVAAVAVAVVARTAVADISAAAADVTVRETGITIAAALVAGAHRKGGRDVGNEGRLGVVILRVIRVDLDPATAATAAAPPPTAA